MIKSFILRYFTLSLLVFCVVFGSNLYAQKTKQETKNKIFERQVDSIIKQQIQEQHIIGISVGVIAVGEILIAKGYGKENVEHDIPATAKTVYKLASVSKQMVAAAIMQLVEKGALSLNDSLPVFFKDAPSSWNAITIRHLLNHTSGLPRESPISDNMKYQTDSLLIRAAYTTPLVFDPGTKWKYCNLGYFMLADIIRQITKQPFDTYMEKMIFQKNGLQQTRTTSASAIIPQRANGYQWVNNDSLINAANYLALRPSGAFVSSIDDMLRWEQLLQRHILLDSATSRQMYTDTVLTSSNPTNIPEYYGYGWDVVTYKGKLMVYHDGSLPGFTTSYHRFVKEGIAVIILTNTDNIFPHKIALRIADLLFADSSNSNPERK